MSKPRFSDLELAEKYSRSNQNLYYSSKYAEFYNYENGVYRATNDRAIKTLVISYCRSIDYMEMSSSKINSVLEILKGLDEIQTDETFAGQKLILNLKNGLFDLNTNELREHTKEYKSSVQLNVIYDPSARCPRFLEVLHQIIPNNSVADYLLQMFMYLLLPTYDYEKIFILCGNGRNGKGTLVSVLHELLGRENYEALDLHTLTKERFMLHSLKNKYVNFCSENNLTNIDIDNLKRLSGNDQISAEIKYERNPISFQNFARIMIQSNFLPRITEVDSAIINRLEVINFPSEFTDSRVDTNLKQHLKTELSGILNLLLSKAGEIIKPDGSVKLNPPQIVKTMTMEAFDQLSNVAEFIKDQCELLPNVACKASHFNAAYRDWCFQYGYKAVCKNQCFNAIRELKKLRIESMTRKHNQVYILGLKLTNLPLNNSDQILLLEKEYNSNSSDSILESVNSGFVDGDSLEVVQEDSDRIFELVSSGNNR